MNRPKDLTRLLQEENPELLRWLEDGAEALGFAMASIQFLLDTEAIVLGGRLPDAVLSDLLARTSRHLGEWFADQPNPPLLLKSSLARDATVLGAAALPLHARLHPSPETVWIKSPEPAAAR